MRLLIWCAEGEHLPRFYGVAWVDHSSRRFATMPIPLNALAGWLRSLWHEFKLGYHGIDAYGDEQGVPHPSLIDLERDRAYRAGFEQGQRDGFKGGRLKGVREMQAVLEQREEHFANVERLLLVVVRRAGGVEFPDELFKMAGDFELAFERTRRGRTKVVARQKRKEDGEGEADPAQ